MFEIGDVLTLVDDNEYTVIDKFENDNRIYVYLVDINDNNNMIYGKLENDEIVELEDVNELKKIINIVASHFS